MARVKRGVTTHARHLKVIKAAKGYYGARKNIFTVATQAVEKASQYAYRDRRNKKRTFRGLWIQRINAGSRQYGLNYSKFKFHGQLPRYYNFRFEIWIYFQGKEGLKDLRKASKGLYRTSGGPLEVF